jgi:hypothetical protein
MSLSEDMARLTVAMREAHESRVAAVGAMHTAVDKQIADIQAEHREMATRQRNDLQQFAATLRRNVATLIHDLDVERATLNADQRRRLDAFIRDLRHDMSDFLHQRSAERRAADASQRQSLDDFMHALRKRTSSFLADVHAARMAVHADQDNARQAWQQFNTEMQQRRAAQPKQPADAAQRDTFTPVMRKHRPGKRQLKATQE